MEQIPEKLDWNTRLVRYFLRNTQLSVLLFLFIVIAGLFAFARFRVEGFPSVNIPLAVVTTIVPGAGPDTINSTVTIPLESELRDVKGVKDISSSSRSNISSILINFDDGADLNAGVQDIRNKIGQVTLPQGAQTPEVFVPEVSGAAYIVGIAGDRPLRELNDVSGVLREKLFATSEVQSLELASNIKEKIYVDVQPDPTQQAIISQLETARVAFPLGQMQTDGILSPLSATAQVNSADELRKFPISLSGPDGQNQVVPLGDIARVYEGADYGGQIHWLGYRVNDTFVNQKGLLYEVKLTPDSDLLQSDEKIKQAISDTQSEIGDAAHIVVVYDQARESQRQVDELVEGAIGGKWESDSAVSNIGYVFGAIWLLMIVMLLFLDWRSAIISIIAIPLSFLFTFAILGAFGIQLNTIVLFSLVLVLGLIADPAIVVIESIKRYIEIGYRSSEAVLRSIHRIGFGVFMAVLTSLVVFIPFGIVSGTFGEIIKYIPLTVIPALLASYFIPMLFLTWLAGKFLKPSRDHQLTNEDDISNLWPIARWFVRANRYILQHAWLSIAIIVLGLIIPLGISAALFSSGQIHQVQFSEPDDNQFITATIPVEANLTETELIQRSIELESVLEPYREFMESSFYGFLDGQGSDGQSLTVSMILLPKAERELKSREINQMLNDDLVARFGEQAFAGEIGAGPPQFAYPVTVKVFDPDPETLVRVSDSVAKKLEEFPEVSAVRFDAQTTTTELKIRLKSDVLAQFGLSAPVVYGQLAAQFAERTLFSLDEDEVTVRVPKESVPNSIDSLKNLGMASPQGLVSLRAIADVMEAEVPSAIKRLQGERYAEVGARVTDTRDIIKVQREITAWAKENAGALGVTERTFENRIGQDEFEKSFQELFTAIGISILITYIIFALFFKSFAQPFIILFAVPLIFIGVFPSLVWLNNGQLGFLEIIGLIMVIGIVENVGIFLIDYANQKTVEGMDKREAISIASGIRFRPIIITKLTAFAGFFPLAIFAPFWRGLAVVAITGILSSGILSLFTTPILYNWLTHNKKASL